MELIMLLGCVIRVLSVRILLGVLEVLFVFLCVYLVSVFGVIMIY